MKLTNLLKIFRKYKPIAEHHTHIETLPVWNWFKIKETNDLKYLFHDYEKNTKAPAIFENIYFEMIFQFEKVDNTLFRLLAEKQYFKSLYLTGKKPAHGVRAAEIEKIIQDKIKNTDGADGLTLNSFIRYIELSFKSIGTLDSKKMSTSYAFCLFEEAKRMNTEINAKNKDHGTI